MLWKRHANTLSNRFFPYRFSAEMNRQPDRILLPIGLFHPVAGMPGNENTIARDKGDLSSVGKRELRCSRKEQNPLILALIIPETVRGSPAMRDNPFNPEVFSPQIS